VSYDINKEQEISGVFLGVDNKPVLGIGYYCSSLLESELDKTTIFQIEKLAKKYNCSFGIESPFIYFYIE
jgi:hypothetical protein